MIRPPVLFVVGCERSGTTWVRSILEAHPAALVPPHESHAWLVAHEGSVAVKSGRGWEVVLQRFDAEVGAPAGLHHWIDRPALVRLVGEAADRGGGPDAAGDWLAAEVLTRWCGVDRQEGARILVEKTPSHVFFAERILRALPAARFVEALRDGRDVCVSMQHRARTKAWVPQTRRSQIQRWVEAVDAGRRAASLPAMEGRWHVVRYESLKVDPATEVASILRFAGLDASPAVVARIVEETRFDRYERTGPDEHRRRGEVGEWRTAFDAADRRLFAELAGATAEAVGYPSGPSLTAEPGS